jgi:hypothetical protein
VTELIGAEPLTLNAHNSYPAEEEGGCANPPIS